MSTPDISVSTEFLLDPQKAIAGLDEYTSKLAATARRFSGMEISIAVRFTLPSDSDLQRMLDRVRKTTVEIPVRYRMEGSAPSEVGAAAFGGGAGRFSTIGQSVAIANRRPGLPVAGLSGSTMTTGGSTAASNTGVNALIAALDRNRDETADLARQIEALNQAMSNGGGFGGGGGGSGGPPGGSGGGGSARGPRFAPAHQAARNAQAATIRQLRAAQFNAYVNSGGVPLVNGAGYDGGTLGGGGGGGGGGGAGGGAPGGGHGSLRNYIRTHPTLARFMGAGAIAQAAVMAGEAASQAGDVYGMPTGRIATLKARQSQQVSGILDDVTGGGIPILGTVGRLMQQTENWSNGNGFVTNKTIEARNVLMHETAEQVNNQTKLARFNVTGLNTYDGRVQIANDKVRKRYELDFELRDAKFRDHEDPNILNGLGRRRMAVRTAEIAEEAEHAARADRQEHNVAGMATQRSTAAMGREAANLDAQAYLRADRQQQIRHRLNEIDAGTQEKRDAYKSHFDPATGKAISDQRTIANAKTELDAAELSGDAKKNAERIIMERQYWQEDQQLIAQGGGDRLKALGRNYEAEMYLTEKHFDDQIAVEQDAGKKRLLIANKAAAIAVLHRQEIMAGRGREIAIRGMEGQVDQNSYAAERLNILDDVAMKYADVMDEKTGKWRDPKTLNKELQTKREQGMREQAARLRLHDRQHGNALTQKFGGASDSMKTSGGNSHQAQIDQIAREQQIADSNASGPGDKAANHAIAMAKYIELARQRGVGLRGDARGTHESVMRRQGRFQAAEASELKGQAAEDLRTVQNDPEKFQARAKYWQARMQEAQMGNRRVEHFGSAHEYLQHALEQSGNNDGAAAAEYRRAAEALGKAAEASEKASKNTEKAAEKLLSTLETLG